LKKCGVTDADVNYFNEFVPRIIKMSEEAKKHNCLIYIDAEQTYIQRSLDSIAH